MALSCFDRPRIDQVVTLGVVDYLGRWKTAVYLNELSVSPWTPEPQWPTQSSYYLAFLRNRLAIVTTDRVSTSDKDLLTVTARADSWSF